MKQFRKVLTFSATVLLLLVVMPGVMTAQMSKVKTVWVILMENHNWTGNNSGAKYGDPDIKGSLLAPYANGQVAGYSGTRRAVFQPAGQPPQPTELSVAGSRNQLWRSCRHPAGPTPTEHAQAFGTTS